MFVRSCEIFCRLDIFSSGNVLFSTEKSAPELHLEWLRIQKSILEGETQMKALLLRLHQEESGQDLIEYALVAALIAFAAVAAMQPLPQQINNAFSPIGSKLTSSL